MPAPAALRFIETDHDALGGFEGRIAVFADEEGKLDVTGRKLNTLTRRALVRALESERFEKLKAGEGMEIAFPVGIAAESVHLVKLPRRAGVAEARKAGGTLAASRGSAPLLVLAGKSRRAADIAFGLVLRGYGFDAHKSARADAPGAVTVMASEPEALAGASAEAAALAEGIFFTRDLINEPSNVLTTDDFAARLGAMQELGLEVEILEEDQLVELGMAALLAVGQGSASPSKVVVMRWQGGDADTPPLALVGKGVVFDTGGISIKPAGGMEEMTMDMGGAGVVSGVMRALALRKAKANVVGLVGIVENMPSGTAMRPGDVVTSMKGDTIEVINTDAEGRLVLADVLWYAQERFKPAAIVDLATLTGAMIVALGHDMAGVFGNDDALADAFLAAARAEGEGAWRLPMGDSYDKLLKSRIADMKNVGGRAAGSITAAQFLGRFVKDEVPWIHLDIAGVALANAATDLAPKGASGWGVLALNRLVKERFEG
ncbi:leucyl aminopeptidase [Oceanicola granulosus HTCC2516]|uniref:Probable cytosol aminopeptidase n=1 Tax=Oceanicola granulosus (strain ATCC BAA-861 / DSM 15982 / KCTC 12143 / HTCC2516) TaxID=314256 RepID=Q2CC17_OCEGH|nr:leucyl aminopeptidase [Oceanicola granulosus]EAR50177.1 leucyl aminopeptidase [Oceanicola granulosus HTCC2516]